MTDQLSKTPLWEWHDAHGGRMVDFAGWWMPVQYTSIVEEHQTTRQHASLFDVSHMGRFQFEGSAALSFLDGMVTRRVSDLQPGQIRYALMTNEKGGILDDILVYRLSKPDDSSRVWMVVNAGNRKKIGRWLMDHLSGHEDVAFVDRTQGTAMIAVQGPMAKDATSSLLEESVDQLGYYRGIVTSLCGREAIVSRTGYTGEDGFEITVDAADAVRVWEILLRFHDSIAAAGLGARDTLRLEAAMPLYGHELSEQINPLEAGLRFAVDLADRDFPGRDALAALDEIPRKRVGLQLSGKRVAREHSPLLSGDEQIGEVTSGTFSPTLKCPIAMGYVQREYSAVGSQLSVDIRGKRHPATIIKLPFYKRS